MLVCRYYFWERIVQSTGSVRGWLQLVKMAGDRMLPAFSSMRPSGQDVQVAKLRAVRPQVAWFPIA